MSKETPPDPPQPPHARAGGGGGSPGSPPRSRNPRVGTSAGPCVRRNHLCRSPHPGPWETQGGRRVPIGTGVPNGRLAIVAAPMGPRHGVPSWGPRLHAWHVLPKMLGGGGEAHQGLAPGGHSRLPRESRVGRARVTPPHPQKTHPGSKSRWEKSDNAPEHPPQTHGGAGGRAGVQQDPLPKAPGPVPRVVCPSVPPPPGLKPWAGVQPLSPTSHPAAGGPRRGPGGPSVSPGQRWPDVARSRGGRAVPEGSVRGRRRAGSAETGGVPGSPVPSCPVPRHARGCSPRGARPRPRPPPRPGPLTGCLCLPWPRRSSGRLQPGNADRAWKITGWLVAGRGGGGAGAGPGTARYGPGDGGTGGGSAGTLGSPRLRSAGLGSAGPGSARLGSAGLGPAPVRALPPPPPARPRAARPPGRGAAARAGPHARGRRGHADTDTGGGEMCARGYRGGGAPPRARTGTRRREGRPRPHRGARARDHAQVRAPARPPPPPVCVHAQREGGVRCPPHRPRTRTHARRCTCARAPAPLPPLPRRCVHMHGGRCLHTHARARTPRPLCACAPPCARTHAPCAHTHPCAHTPTCTPPHTHTRAPRCAHPHAHSPSRCGGGPGRGLPRGHRAPGGRPEGALGTLGTVTPGGSRTCLLPLGTGDMRGDTGT